MLQNQIGAEALTAVIEYLPSQYTKRMLDSKSERAAYITALLESKQRPFIWEYFRPGTIEIPRGEEMYYDEVSHSLSLSRVLDCSKRRASETPRPISIDPHPPCLLDILHITRYPDATPIRRPWTSNWCACTCGCCSKLEFLSIVFLTHFFQVERGYFLHRSGDYISSANEFSTTNWLRATNMYIDKIKNDLTDDNWMAIFDTLHRLQESRAHEAQVEAGMVLEEREPLLPADPPTPPPA